MPQMSPLNWLILYPYFLILLYCFVIMIYFMNNNNSPVLTKFNSSIKPKNWKW